MAGYGYTYRGGYTTCNGVAPRTDGWGKTSYTSDHECQPVFVDADGRRKPIMSYTPNGSNEYYVTRTEVVEVPFVTGYKQSTPVKVEVLRDHGDVAGGKWNRPSSPERWRRPSSPVRYHVEEKWNKPSSPVRYHAEQKWNRPSSPARYHAEEKWNRPSSPVRYYVEEKWNRPSSPVHERPQQVEEFITKIQTQASRPNKVAPVSATCWRPTPNSNTGYGDQSDLSNKEWQKPSGNTIRDENYGGRYKRDEVFEPIMTTNGGASDKQSHRPYLSQSASDINKRDSYQEPTMSTNGGAWAKPSQGGWSKGQGANLSQPTNDINTAMEYLKEAAKQPSSGINPPPPRYTTPAPTGPKRDTYPETIDSREAERRYGNSNIPSRPINTYTITIDSREAARKYGGTTV